MLERITYDWKLVKIDDDYIITHSNKNDEKHAVCFAPISGKMEKIKKKENQMEKIDFDKYIMKVFKLIPGTVLENYMDYSVETSHMLFHAVITFTILTLPISPWYGLISLGLAILKEVVNDGLFTWKGVPKHDISNLIFRSLGAVFPFLSLLWK